MMDKFLKWHESSGYKLMESVGELEDVEAYGVDAWQESAKHGEKWHDIIKECEKLLGCNDTAESPLMCNLPNLIRDLIHREENKARYERERIVEYILDVATDESLDGLAALQSVAENLKKDNLETEETDRIEKE